MKSKLVSNNRTPTFPHSLILLRGGDCVLARVTHQNTFAWIVLLFAGVDSCRIHSIFSVDKSRFARDARSMSPPNKDIDANLDLSQIMLTFSYGPT